MGLAGGCAAALALEPACLSWCQAGSGSARLPSAGAESRSGWCRALGVAVRTGPAPESSQQWGPPQTRVGPDPVTWPGPLGLSRAPGLCWGAKREVSGLHPLTLGGRLWLQVPLAGPRVVCPARDLAPGLRGTGHVGVAVPIQTEPSQTPIPLAVCGPHSPPAHPIITLLAQPLPSSLAAVQAFGGWSRSLPAGPQLPSGPGKPS